MAGLVFFCQKLQMFVMDIMAFRFLWSRMVTMTEYGLYYYLPYAQVLVWHTCISISGKRSHGDRVKSSEKFTDIYRHLVSWGKKEPGVIWVTKIHWVFAHLILFIFNSLLHVSLIWSLIYVHYRFVALIPETQRDPRVSDIKNDMEKVFVSVIIICLHCYQACDVRMQSVCHH